MPDVDKVHALSFCLTLFSLFKHCLDLCITDSAQGQGHFVGTLVRGVGVHHGVTFNFGPAKVCLPAIF